MAEHHNGNGNFAITRQSAASAGKKDDNSSTGNHEHAKGSGKKDDKQGHGNASKHK